MMIMSMIAVMICGNGGHGVYALTSKLGGRSGGGRGSFGRGRGGGALQRAALRQEPLVELRGFPSLDRDRPEAVARAPHFRTLEIGRGSGREKGCEDEEISVVAGT